MRTSKIQRAGFLTLLLCACPGSSVPRGVVERPVKRLETREEVRARSDENAKLLQRAFAEFEPESAAESGLEGYDDRVVDWTLDRDVRLSRALEGVRTELSQRLLREQEPRVRSDLEILLHATSLRLERIRLEDKYEVPLFDVASMVHGGLASLLDERVPESRRKTALVRLRLYTGSVPGTTPLTTLAMARTNARIAKPGLVFPSKAATEKLLRRAPVLTTGIADLFPHAEGETEKLLAQLRTQLAAYEAFVRDTILPRARSDFRQPQEMYELALREAGIDGPPLDFAVQARAAFQETKARMQELAPRVAREKGYSVSTYDGVIRELKKTQVTGAPLLELYRKRSAEIDDILRREHLVSLPLRPMQVRMATDAESAQIPAPFFSPPRMVDNRGEIGVFVLPSRLADVPEKRLDDFSYEAASWWLSAHEGRPGHELQFATMIERKLSIARAIFAFNSVNAEGWGLYAEDLLRPFMPIDAQLVCLQARLMRTAHAFLDIELNLGKISIDEARRIMHDEAVFSDAWTDQSIERYTFKWPAQAPSYFYGYSRLVELRGEAKRAMGSKFDLLAFHTFVLDQGLVSPAVLRRAVMSEFVR